MPRVCCVFVEVTREFVDRPKGGSAGRDVERSTDLTLRIIDLIFGPRNIYESVDVRVTEDMVVDG